MTDKQGNYFLIIAVDKMSMFNTVGHLHGSLVGFVRYMNTLPPRIQELVAVVRLVKQPAERVTDAEFYALESADTFDAKVIQECLQYQKQQHSY